MAGNLFHSMFSQNTKNTYVSAGYTCDNAINTGESSADFSSAGTNDSTGPSFQITDSNGDVLTGMDLDQVHASPVTEYGNETTVLQPGGVSFIPGLEYGLGYRSVCFRVCKDMMEVDDWEYYTDLEFDIRLNKNFCLETIHIDTRTVSDRKKKDVIEIVSDMLSDLGMNVTVVIDNESKEEQHVRFTSGTEGFWFDIKYLLCHPIYNDDEHPDSPFELPQITAQDIIDAICDVRPKKIEHDHCHCKPGEKPETDGKYQIDCDLYEWIVKLLQEGLDNFDKDTRTADEFFHKFYHHGWRPDDIRKIYSRIYERTGLRVKDNQQKEIHVFRKVKACDVPAVKYPNGALRGLMITVEYPANSDQEAQSLMICHVRDEINLYTPMTCGDVECYKKETVNVDLGLGHSPVTSGNCCCPCACETTVAETTVSLEENGPVYCDTLEPEELERRSVGKQEFLKWVDENGCWLPFGQFYGVIAQADPDDGVTKCLLPSFFLFNPNGYMVKVNILKFV